MDSNDTKQIIIGYIAIKDACRAMLEPIRINLSDGETVHSMSKAGIDTLAGIEMECRAIQNALEFMAGEIGDLEETLHDDGEVDAAGKMISDILWDIPPVPTKLVEFAPTDMVEFAETVVMGRKVEKRNIWENNEISLSKNKR